jgi:uncharacterized protein (TIGR03067 family)
MRVKWIALLAGAAVLGLVAARADDKKPDDKKPDDKGEAKKFEGTWEVVKATGNGMPIEQKSTLVLEGNKYTRTRPNGDTDTGTFSVDPSKKPKTIDVMPGDGKAKDKTWLGIYELDGDSLKICLAEPGKDRPDDFTSKEGSGRMSAEYKRKKP